MTWRGNAENEVRKKVEEELTANYPKYYRLAYSYVRNEPDALDIVQESAYKAMKGCESVKDETVIATWIYRIVINTALDVLRKRQKEYRAADVSEVEKGVEENGYEYLDIMELLSALDDKDRVVLILRYFEDLPLEEIGVITGEKVNTVKSRLYRALHKLRISL